jgi:hypothetical protein
MLFSTFTVAFALAATATALPWPGKPTTYTPASKLNNLAKLFPQSDLPSPDGLELKYVVLGLGTQNYTCTTGDPNATPGTTGAYGKLSFRLYRSVTNANKATLYDIGTKLNNDRMAKWKIGSISPLALSVSEWAPNMVDMSMRTQGYEHVAGHHFFGDVQGTNTPIFAFDQLKAPYPVTKVAKLDATDAPKTACPGKNGLPAVAWLYLKDQQGLSQGGINTVYRVETAGGNRPATCKGMKPTWEVKYAAQCKYILNMLAF